MSHSFGDYSPSQVLDIRGPRGALSVGRARELAEPVLSGGRTDVERLILSTWALSAESADVFAAVIGALPSLRSAVLADIVAGRPEAEGLAVYRCLAAALLSRSLEELDLSDNAVGTKGVEVFRDLLSSQSTLQRLFFCNCGISAEAARSIADAVLARGADAPTALRVVHFDNNMSGGGGAAAVADIVSASPALQDFRFTSSRGTADGGVALARALGRCTSLTRINVRDNIFAAPFAVALGASVGALSSLAHLDVGDTLVRDAGAAALAAGLSRAHALRFLDISENELTVRGAKSLALILARLPGLETVLAGGNEFGEVGAGHIALAARAAPNLVTLALCSCELGARGALAIARAVAGAPRLAELDLNGNGMGARTRDLTMTALTTAGRSVGVLKTGDDDDDEDEDDYDDDLDDLYNVVTSAAFVAKIIGEADAREAAVAASSTTAPAPVSTVDADVLNSLTAALAATTV